MTAGWGARTVRAAVFAAVCVLLAALGHALMAGSAVPWWTVSAGFAATAAVGWALADRERGLTTVVSVVVVAQGALHSAFSWALQAAPGAGAAPSASGTNHLHGMHHQHGRRPTDVMDGMVMDGMDGMSMESMADGHLGSTAHGDGMSSLGMLAAHTAAALLTGLWLAYGERAAFRLLRTVAARLAAPLRLPLAVLPVPARRPRVRPTRERAERLPRLTLTHTIISRGPPAATAVI
ncbi:hypothetical protein [Streptomyces hilarionis]|uniref:hypothetical protein n=1 Tax=Streptomyces hilarionis TaxID=2839954 RepID=UPI00211A05D0|nr:hypothetical protein [Streptomyces hilarionis]MCQ9129572.1 hypothetical protein [Streptomyces hilarionis]